MKNYIQPGDVLSLTAPSGGVVSGNGYKIGQNFVVATGDAAEGEPFQGKTTGVFELDKATGATWSEGQLLYWDDTAKNVTTTNTSDMLIGSAVEAEASGDTVGLVRLNGIAQSTGVDSAGIQDLAITTAKLADDAVTAAKLADDASVDANRAVTTDHIRDLAVTTAKVNDLAVTTGKIAAGAVTYAKAATFVSTEQTGTGAPQNVAHGLGVIPAAVLIVPTDTAPATTGAYTAVEGVHTITNVVVTVTSGKKFKVFAWA